MKDLAIFFVGFVVIFLLGLGVISLVAMSQQSQQPQKVIIEIKSDEYEIKPVPAKPGRVLPESEKKPNLV